jgi:diguanylate cyclase (GGDEF)-like protein/PAS domain S-box-containing protein
LEEFNLNIGTKKTVSNNIDEFLNPNNESKQNELAYYKEMFKLMIQHAPVAMYIIEDNNFSYINRYFCDLLGYQEGEAAIKGLTFNNIIHPEDLPIVLERVRNRLAGIKTPERYRLRALKKDGSLIYVEVNASITEVNGKLATMGAVIDVTEEVTAQIQLKENQDRFQSLFYHNPDAIFMMDTEGKFLEVNPGCEVLSGFPMSELIEMTFMPLVITEDLPKTINHFEQAIMGISSNYDITITRKDGVKRNINISAFPMKVAGEIVGACGIAKDITENVQYRKQIEQLAFYDPLTKLPNRQLFEDRLQQVIDLSQEQEEQTAVLFVDLDRFKFINDSLGHHFGDEFLKIISERLKNALRKTDTVSRFAGDEFTIMLPNTTEEDVIQLAQRLNKILVEPYIMNGHTVAVSASIGIAFTSGQEEHASDLIKKADTAMYYTKKFGKNNYSVYSKELDSNASFKLIIERDIKSAIKKNQFILHYQPIIELDTGEVTGMEALIRWNHPELGLLSPDKFIPVSEESGQIISIGKWVLRTACSQNKKWQTLGYSPFRIAVNISPIQIQHQNFVETVRTILEETGLDPKWLELEVTESILMEDTEELKISLLKLKELGVSISIDDFGTGYTSLSYLRQFSFDRVKIDRSFINDINLDSNGKAITSTIITLAHKLNMRVTAEGIEDTVQLSYLKDEKSNEGQGFYFSRPLPAEMHKFPFQYSTAKNR